MFYYVSLTRAKDFVIDKTKNSFEYSDYLARLEENKQNETKQENLEENNEERMLLRAKRRLK